MSDSEDNSIIPSTASADYSDDDGPSTSWGLKRRNKCSIISDSENDDDEDLGEEVVKGASLAMSLWKAESWFKMFVLFNVSLELIYIKQLAVLSGIWKTRIIKPAKNL